MSTTAISFIIIILILVTIIVYAIVMYEMAKNKTFIFSRYDPEPTFTQHIRPMGPTKPLTQEEIDNIQKLVQKALSELNHS